MGNSQNSKQQIIKNQKSSQPLQQNPIKEENPIKLKKKDENDLEIEFFKLLADTDRKDKWKTYFKINDIKSMADLLSSYQMNSNTKTGKRLNEAEKQILNNYLLRQSKEEDIQIIIKDIGNLKRLTYNKSPHNINKIRNILIVGITGQGKSTFINSFVTAIEREFKPREKGKQFSLDYFEIVKVKDQQAQSDTNEVSSYKFIIGDILINLIDTPGLADTEGLLKDQERITQISKYIEEHLYNKNQNLHAILFVSQSSTQYEVIDSNPTFLQLSMLSILKLFGIEMCAFTKHCLTFSDFTATSTQNFESQDSIFYSVREEQIMIKQRQGNQQQNIMETLILEQDYTIQQTQNFQEEKKYNKEEFYYQFQNSVFRAKKQGFIENIHLKKNLLNYERLYHFIIDDENKGFSLERTVLVINQRTQIKNELGGLQKKLQQFIKVLKSVDENTRKLEIYKNKIKDTKMYESTIYITMWEKMEIVINGKKAYSTNCNECGKTCCKKCESNNLHDCNEMVPSGSQFICQKCNHLGQCHTQEEFYWQSKDVPKIIVDEYLKNEHENANKNKNTIDQLLKQQEIERNETKDQIKKVLVQMKECLQNLLSSALYKLDILDVEAYEFVLKFYPDYKKQLEDFQNMDDLKVKSEVRDKVKKNKLVASKTLLSVETLQFQSKQFKRS
ncbi:unnamed protein product [Paramecium primaurelia]|uniref:Tr-type G domain-containing protein n=1 Tax=Paramecium primaurelia TaxID=5886 RepID=A0A8S1NVG2_PARPR|nr:unnamed protein product [Paramecium primaurelia]